MPEQPASSGWRNSPCARPRGSSIFCSHQLGGWRESNLRRVLVKRFLRTNGGGWVVERLILVACGANVAGHILEARALLDEGHLDSSGGSVALLGDDDLSQPFEFGLILFVDFFAEDESDYVSVLLDRARFAQVRQLWAIVS